ncbi:MAG: 2,3-bisphosphoglycerate-independent phosphoglycerate mutase [Planctomycetota bacterium]|jgi:2,3-bisphosphoglycerate-independent phosphoglycerate mutase|nr:2,3-bisphosphoglycerate-independent phosphoglycerate mutase [Planctomycetota bacterium]
MSASGDAQGSGGAAKDRDKSLFVRTGQGGKYRFLRGMITHDLVKRGYEFDLAYSVARSIRDRLSDRTEVTTAEIRDLIEAEVDQIPNDSVSPESRSDVPGASQLLVEDNDRNLPFSRGVLARSIAAAGIDLDRAYRLAGELESDLRREGSWVTPRLDLARRIGELIERSEGKGAARRYRLMRHIHHQLPRPLIVYIGGAAGTGKSTLALELAPLLRTYRVIATDTIRQVMRMVFSPSILPALYHSSFEAESSHPLDLVGFSSEETVGSGSSSLFLEQSTRVCVGIRAVVDRAISENMNIVVEGVHLFPPLVPLSDLEGSAYQVPILLGTQEKEVHRSRFLSRARLGGRRAERYLKNFGSIRTIQDFLLEQSEQWEVPLLDTSHGEPPVQDVLRLITGFLEERLPRDRTLREDLEGVGTLLLIIDGLADRPVRAFGGRTPLQAAETPNLDRLVAEGQCGLADPISPGVVADTAAGTLALFGQSPAALKRGPVEALGAGLKLGPADVALRGNLATLDGDGNVIDRRAGRIREGTFELAEAIDRISLPGSLSEEVEVRVKAATEHRLAIVIRGEGLSSDIHGSDPGDGASPCLPLTPRPKDSADESAVHTARVLALFEQEANRVLADHPINRKRRQEGLPEANLLLTRGAGKMHRLLPLEESGFPLRVACISGDQTVLGIASRLQADIFTDERMTANLDTRIDVKFDTVIDALEDHDLVVLHMKGADIAAHDQRPELKVSYLEKLDRELGKFLDRFERPLRIAVASDHATLSESGQHAADPLPVLIWGVGIEADVVERYDEVSVARGALRRFPLQTLLSHLERSRG